MQEPVCYVLIRSFNCGLLGNMADC